MHYFVFVSVTTVFALLASPALSRTALRPGSAASPSLASPTPGPAKLRARLDPDRLYSQRERRRIANYLRLRLDIMRYERLDRAVEVIERRLPVDALLEDPTPAPALPSQQPRK